MKLLRSMLLVLFLVGIASSELESLKYENLTLSFEINDHPVGINVLYSLIVIGFILMLIFFEIKPRHSAINSAVNLIAFFALIICGALAVIGFIWVVHWIYSQLGLAVFILGLLISLWAIAYLLIKYYEKILISILGAALTAKIKAFLAGMSILINTPIGFVTISLGSVTWIGLFNEKIGQEVTMSVPAYVLFVAGVILCWGIITMIGSLVDTLKSTFHSSAEPNNQG